MYADLDSILIAALDGKRSLEEISALSQFAETAVVMDSVPVQICALALMDKFLPTVHQKLSLSVASDA